MKIKTENFFVTKTQHQILVSNKNSFVNIPSNNSESCSYLVDTGASLSACKYKHVLNNGIPIHNENIFVNGLGGKVQAIGYVYLNLYLGSLRIRHKFYVFKTLPIQCNGILGRDFLERFKAKIDLGNSKLTLHLNSNKEISLPFTKYCNDPVSIPKRSESIHYIQTSLKEDSVICSMELQDGVFLAGSIVSPVNGVIPIKILNVTEKDLMLPSVNPIIHKLEKYNICAFNRSIKNADRVKKLFANLQLDHLNDEEQTTIENICAKYADIFYLKGDSLSTTDVYKHTITVKPNTNPIFTKPYKLPYSQKTEVTAQINKMLKEKIIEPSTSEWSSPILLVPKKLDKNGNKQWRLVIDYRKINNCIQDDKYPLPDITEILDSLTGSVYFSHLDLHQGYYNVELQEDSRKYTAFNAGQFQMTRMPMGLKTSPSSFSRMMNIALAGLNYEKCLIYLDDLIIFGRNLETHNKNLQDVFERLKKVNLKLNPTKCEFLKKEILYLGHVITNKGILPDPQKITVVKNYPCPTNSDEVKRFVAFTNYYRKFVPNFANIAQPLNSLCKKNSKFEWNSDCQKSFEKLKECMITPPVLDYPDLTEQNQFLLQTDASNNAIGAILSNKNGRPVAFASRTLNKAEKNYPVIEKELLAIVWSIKYFRPYLYGRKFKIRTDHKPLIYLFNMRDPSSRLMKFRLALEEYNFEVEYVKGSDNAAADALSRISLSSDELKEMHSHVLSVMTRAQRKKLNNVDLSVDTLPTNSRPDQPRVVSTAIKPRGSIELQMIDIKDLNKIKKKFVISKESKTLCYISSKNVIFVKVYSESQISRGEFVNELELFCAQEKINELCIIKSKINKTFIKKLVEEMNKNKSRSGLRLCVLNNVQRVDNKDDRRVILNDYHLLPSSGHAGMRRMSNNIKKYYYWPGLDKDVKEFVKRCEKCQTQKHCQLTKEPMVITTTSHTAFEKIYLDLVGPLDTDNYNFSYILTLQCELTKYVEAYPLITKQAPEVARAFVNNFILRYGVPNVIATDRGKEFTSTVFKEVCTLLKISQLQSTAYHHQSIGALEVTHKNLKSFLRIQTDNNPETWSQWLPYWCFAHNTSVHTETKFTPYELVFGRACSLPNNLMKQVDPLYNYDSYPCEMKYRLQISQKQARENLLKSKHKRKNVYDKNLNSKSYKKDDLILVKNEIGNKLDPVYLGPYKVIKDTPPNVEIIKNGKLECVHKNRTKLYFNLIV